MFAGDGLQCCVNEVAALVAQAALHWRKTHTNDEKQKQTTTKNGLPVSDHPDKGADARVVEHLLGQGDDGFELVTLDDPAADLALATAGAAGEQRRAVKDDGGT